MKSNKQLKQFGLVLALLILFQSCTVYNTANISLAEAVESNTETKIEYKDGKKVKHLRIYQDENGDYYWIKKAGAEGAKIEYKTPIDENKVKNINLKDEKKSSFVTTLFTISIIGVILAVIRNELFDGWLI